MGFWAVAGPALGNMAGGALSGLLQGDQAKKNRQFQERMSSTSHQREVADLRAAGLNPILSAGGGASSPSGSMADMPDLSQIGTSTTASAQQSARVKQEGDAIKQQVQTGKAVEQREQTQKDLNIAEKIYTRANTALIREHTKEAAAKSWGAQNVVRMKQKAPNFFGVLESYGPAILPMINTLLSATATGAAIKGVGSLGKMVFDRGVKAKGYGKYNTGE